MNNNEKLNSGQLHLMRLILQDSNEEGWTRVSKQVYPLISALPSDLVELTQEEDESGYAKLTEHGHHIMEAAQRIKFSN